MGAGTSIQWTDYSWSTWWGCTRVSPGCASCYAATFAHRFGVEWGKGKERRLSSPKIWEDPYRWDRAAKKSGQRKKVFLGSMMDWADQEVPPEWRAKMWKVVKECTHLDFQMLTKRAGDIRASLPADWGEGYPNVWLGVSVENQAATDRITILAGIQAAVRFLSVEPMLGSIRLAPIIGQHIMDNEGKMVGIWERIQWAICGGESGPGARPFNVAWARSIVEQCRDARIACFVKQLGSNPFNDEIYAPPSDAEFPPEVKHQWIGNGTFRPILKDRKGGDMDEWPPDLRVRQFPGEL